jgi:hypothetical protein
MTPSRQSDSDPAPILREGLERAQREGRIGRLTPGRKAALAAESVLTEGAWERYQRVVDGELDGAGPGEEGDDV